MAGHLHDWELTQPPTPQQLPSGHRGSVTQWTETTAGEEGRKQFGAAGPQRKEGFLLILGEEGEQKETATAPLPRGNRRAMHMSMEMVY